MDYVKHFDRVVTLEKEGRIATIEFVCPQNENRINEQLVDELGRALKDADDDRDIWVIVLKSQGDVFLGTGDFQHMIVPVMMKGMSYSRKIMHDIGNIVRMMYRCGKLIITALDGAAVGGGCGLTLSSDIIIASEKATFNEYQFAIAGLPLDSGGLWSLQRLVGPMKAKYLAIRPQVIDAKEALELGIVVKVVPSEKLAEEVSGLANYVAGLSPVGINAIKQMSNRMSEYSLDTYLQQEAEYIAMSINSKDFQARLQAMRAKSKPEIIGD